MKVIINLLQDAELSRETFPRGRVNTFKEFDLKGDLFGYTYLKVIQSQYFGEVKVELSGKDKESLHLNGSLIESILQIYL